MKIKIETIREFPDELYNIWINQLNIRGLMVDGEKLKKDKVYIIKSDDAISVYKILE